MTPEFAILGHPNEGKSSVLSTLAEDDSVRVSPTPGETTECRTFPVVIDGREVVRFTDTPGFQNPARVLSELRKRGEQNSDPLQSFRQFAATVPELHDDCELLSPVERGAGIIYVVDGSRPVRNVDRAEMEILRLTGKPRMAVINCKEDDNTYLDDWKVEFRKNFNANRVFNAHRATYAERILLLEALKAIDQDWQPVLSRVVDAFKKDWKERNATSSDAIYQLISEALTLTVRQSTDTRQGGEAIQQKLFAAYKKQLAEKEHHCHQKIRSLFKHNIFNYDLPPHSIVHADLFSQQTWQLMGLTRKQLILAGGLGGAALGAGLEVATLGHALGLFTAMGGVAGALGALIGGEKLTSRINLPGVSLGGEQLQIGPAKSIELLFVLLNRALLYYRHTINWAHGRRDYPANNEVAPSGGEHLGFTSNWSTAKIKICHDFFKVLQKSRITASAAENENFRTLILQCLEEISEYAG
ncbi:GTPase/DUF3482 domain-containing protein [Desulforhopalus singaporensis]|uniref:50S ribosome-binding GTPase n=1 Tax=Desulforhopalus singaporensis TaxID=91360 RepID=A0A1H0UHP6_9BACT|nr:GTPase/DUF3482 domain-containing protein [Desulforhopalus singaporensis]SDP65555.1 50S ribosome-binding GTPase [Desulforhopalus singaporensis]